MVYWLDVLFLLVKAVFLLRKLLSDSIYFESNGLTS